MLGRAGQYEFIFCVLCLFVALPLSIDYQSLCDTPCVAGGTTTFLTYHDPQGPMPGAPQLAPRPRKTQPQAQNRAS